MAKPKLHTLKEGNRYFLLGNHAIARGALEAGLNLASAYPGTPSSEILDALASSARELGFYAEWSVNEKVALEVAIGASYSGLRCLTAMKHVGVNVALDALATIAYTGVSGALVLVSADDPGAHSSQNEQDNRILAKFTKIFCLEPYDAQSAMDYTIKAFEISEKFSIPVMLRTTTRINHARGDVLVGVLPKSGMKSEFKKNFSRYVCIPANARLLHRELNKKLEEMERYATESTLNNIKLNGSYGIITSGVSRNYVREAIDTLGAEVSLFELGITNPFPKQLVKRFLSKIDRILVVEELEPFLEEQVKALAGDIEVSGKDILPRDGEFNVEIVKNAVAGFLGLEIERVKREDISPVPRPPVLCPGCGHRALYYALKKITEKKIYSGDIGCYTLGALEPLKTMDTCLCMGSSLGIAQGFYHAGVEEDIIALIGDSTFFHAGIPSLLNAVYNRANILLIIMDNRTTAMTGHQPNPGVGVTAIGTKTVAVDLEELVKALKVDFVAKVKPSDLEASIEVIKNAIDLSGVRVIIAEEPCALMGRKLGLWRTPPKVTREKCEGYLCRGCRACLKIGCPAVSWERGKAKMIPELCTGCDLCIIVCPVEAIGRDEND